MATFVLVHGAWHGAWCWRRVVRLLTRNGHEAFAPTLTGVGERSHLLAPAVGLDTHVLDVVNEMKWQELNNVVLVGHSYGGMVISGVAEKMEKAIASIVMLDAFVPEDGQAIVDTAAARDAGHHSCGATRRRTNLAATIGRDILRSTKRTAPGSTPSVRRNRSIALPRS